MFRHLPAPTATELASLVEQIAERIGKALERRGLVERDMENVCLAGDGSSGPLHHLPGRGGSACLTEAVHVADSA